MYCMVITTLPNEREAKELAAEILKERLAACVQVGSVDSYFAWEGEMRSESEKIMYIKTKVEHYKELERLIIKMHSYEVPEIIKLDVKDGLDEYLSWIDTVVR